MVMLPSVRGRSRSRRCWIRPSQPMRTTSDDRSDPMRMPSSVPSRPAGRSRLSTRTTRSVARSQMTAAWALG